MEQLEMWLKNLAWAVGILTGLVTTLKNIIDLRDKKKKSQKKKKRRSPQKKRRK